MKYLVKSVVFAITTLTLLLIASCSKSDTSNPVKEEAVKEEPKVEAPSPEAANKIADNVIIKGSSRVEGYLPAPKGDMEYYGTDPRYRVIPGYLNEGFNIHLTSSKEVAGAYIQIMANGARAESYYNVDVKVNNGEDETGKRVSENKILEKNKKISESKIPFAIIDVDIGPEFIPRKFCYLISVYDADGNVSKPFEECVKINAWGGSDDLLGDWHFTKSEIYFPSGETEVVPVNSEGCLTRKFICPNGSELDYEDCTTWGYRTYNFKADGTYEETSNIFINTLDWNASEASCELIYSNYSFEEVKVSNGNWSYDPESKILVVVEYTLSSDTGFGPYESMSEPGNAFVNTLGISTLDSDQLSLGYGYTDLELLGEDLNGDGVVNDEDTITLFFYEKL